MHSQVFLLLAFFVKLCLRFNQSDDRNLNKVHEMKYLPGYLVAMDL